MLEKNVGLVDIKKGKENIKIFLVVIVGGLVL